MRPTKRSSKTMGAPFTCNRARRNAMGACERFETSVAGKGGHAAMPHLTIDPLAASSAIVLNLQSVAARNMSPLESGVVSIAQINGGSGAFNIIPHSAMLKGTIRALSTEVLLQMRDRVQHIVESMATTCGCNTTISHSPDCCPVTKNDKDLCENFSKHVGALASEEGAMRDTEPTMGTPKTSRLSPKR